MQKVLTEPWTPEKWSIDLKSLLMSKSVLHWQVFFFPTGDWRPWVKVPMSHLFDGFLVLGTDECGLFDGFVCLLQLVLQHCEHWGKMMANIAIPEDPFALTSFECYINTASCSSLPQGSRQCQTKIWNPIFQLESWKRVCFYFQAEMLLASSFRGTKLSSFSRTKLTWCSVTASVFYILLKKISF